MTSPIHCTHATVQSQIKYHVIPTIAFAFFFLVCVCMCMKNYISIFTDSSIFKQGGNILLNLQKTHYLVFEKWWLF